MFVLQVTFRSGNPQYASELEKVRIEYAKSILVLAGDEQDVNEADSDALRTVNEFDKERRKRFDG